MVSRHTRNLDSLEVVFFHTHKTHFINSPSFVPRAWRCPMGRDGALLSYQTLTLHPTIANCKTPNHSTTLGQAKHHQAWLSGEKGTEVP